MTGLRALMVPMKDRPGSQASPRTGASRPEEQALPSRASPGLWEEGSAGPEGQLPQPGPAPQRTPTQDRCWGRCVQEDQGQEGPPRGEAGSGPLSDWGSGRGAGVSMRKKGTHPACPMHHPIPHTAQVRWRRACWEQQHSRPNGSRAHRPALVPEHGALTHPDPSTALVPQDGRAT